MSTDQECCTESSKQQTIQTRDATPRSSDGMRILVAHLRKDKTCMLLSALHAACLSKHLQHPSHAQLCVRCCACRSSLTPGAQTMGTAFSPVHAPSSVQLPTRANRCPTWVTNSGHTKRTNCPLVGGLGCAPACSMVRACSVAPFQTRCSHATNAFVAMQRVLIHCHRMQAYLSWLLLIVPLLGSLSGPRSCWVVC